MSDIAQAVSSREGSIAVAHDVLLRTSESSAGGARRNRTDDLLLAKQALSQLSYGPAGGQMTDDGGQKSALPSSVVRILSSDNGGPGKT